MDKRRFAGLSSLTDRQVIPTHAINNRVLAPTGLHHPVHGGFPDQLPAPAIVNEVQQPDATRLPIDSSLRQPFSLGEW